MLPGGRLAHNPHAWGLRAAGSKSRADGQRHQRRPMHIIHPPSSRLLWLCFPGRPSQSPSRHHRARRPEGARQLDWMALASAAVPCCACGLCLVLLWGPGGWCGTCAAELRYLTYLSVGFIGALLSTRARSAISSLSTFSLPFNLSGPTLQLSGLPCWTRGPTSSKVQVPASAHQSPLVVASPGCRPFPLCLAIGAVLHCPPGHECCLERHLTPTSTFRPFTTATSQPASFPNPNSPTQLLRPTESSVESVQGRPSSRHSSAETPSVLSFFKLCTIFQIQIHFPKTINPPDFQFTRHGHQRRCQ